VTGRVGTMTHLVKPWSQTSSACGATLMAGASLGKHTRKAVDHGGIGSAAASGS
jgi:hypothetical protein